MKIQDFIKTKTLTCDIRGNNEDVARAITQLFIDNNIPLDTEFDAIERNGREACQGCGYYCITEIIVSSEAINKERK